MNTDRELLELAAKAMRATGNPHFMNYTVMEDGSSVCLELGSQRGAVTDYWKPLHDDGDALRLAVKLSLPIEFREAGFGYDKTPENRRVMCGKYWDSNESRNCMFAELYGSDVHAATRRAIVRAAAEIGRAMEPKLMIGKDSNPISPQLQAQFERTYGKR